MDQRPERPRLPDQIIELPRFDLPFPSDISPLADSIIEHTSWWAREVGLAADGQAVERLRRGGIMNAGPRLVPAAPMSAACLVCDWTVFLIVIDDEFDDGNELGVRPELARAAIEDVITSFRGQEPRSAHLAGSARAAADLGRRFELGAPSQEWLPRFRRHAEEHLWSKVSEAKQRTSGVVLDVPSYVGLRRITGAPYTYADLVELAEHVVIAERVQESPVWGLTLDAFADVWLGIQDICSCAKEVAAGDELNLAAVLARTEGCTIQQGIDSAYRWVCERSRDFAVHRAQLAALPRRLGLDSRAEMDLARYLDSLERLLGGHLAWNSQDNPRYSQVISRSQAR
ncbi:MAG TPA: terpene synthase family protein [Streptosporangiaceae bacterium]